MRDPLDEQPAWSRTLIKLLPRTREILRLEFTKRPVKLKPVVCRLNRRPRPPDIHVLAGSRKRLRDVPRVSGYSAERRRILRCDDVNSARCVL